MSTVAGGTVLFTAYPTTAPGTTYHSKACDQAACDVGGTGNPTSVSESYGLSTPSLCASNGGTGCVTNAVAVFSETTANFNGYTEELWPTTVHGNYDAATVFHRTAVFEVDDWTRFSSPSHSTISK
jgi:hypothetical protein